MEMEGDWIYDEEGSWSKEGLEICGLDGCPFRGSKSVLQDHILYLHTTGVYNRLTRENDPEEVAAWRKQRKSKYPTFSQTESHRFEQQARKEQYVDISKARAEAFELFKEERKRVTKNVPFSNNKRNRNNKKQAKRKQNRLEKRKKEDFLDDEEDPPGWNGPLVSFPGTKFFNKSECKEEEEEEKEEMVQDTFNISDDEEDVLLHTQMKEKRQLENDIRKKVTEERDDKNIVDPMSDNDDEPPEEIAIIKKRDEIPLESNETLVEHPKKNENDSFDKVEDASYPDTPDSQAAFSFSKSNDLIEKPSRKRKHKNRRSGNNDACISKRNGEDLHLPEQKPEVKSKEPSIQLPNNDQNWTKSPYCIEPPVIPRVRFNRLSKQNTTLLEKLLSSEMKREKKLILQSVKYVCDNNFFL